MVDDIKLFSVVRYKDDPTPMLVVNVYTSYVRYETEEGEVGLALKRWLTVLREPLKIKRSP